MNKKIIIRPIHHVDDRLHPDSAGADCVLRAHGPFRGLYHGKCPLRNIGRTCKGPLAFSGTFLYQHSPLPDPCLSSGHGSAFQRDGPGKLYRFYLHPSHVDEFSSPDLAWQTLLEKNGVINGVLTALHLPNQNLINTSGAIILGMVYNFLPFMVLPIYNVLMKIDDNVINAARDLGANTVQILFRILFPLSIPGIVSGITMVFVPALTTFVISNLLGGSKILLIGNVIEQEFTRGSNWNLGSGLSLVLMIFILISMALIAKYDKNGEGTAF